MLPNFINIGAGKCASSWLWRVYQEHPDVFVPLHLDNVNFFVADYAKGLDWYEKTYFDDWDGEKAVGEMSNSYMVFEPAIERIARDTNYPELILNKETQCFRISCTSGLRSPHLPGF